MPINNTGNQKSVTALVVTCSISIAFVFIVGILISLLQYQNRLNRAAPALTARQIVEFVTNETLFDEVSRNITVRSLRLSRLQAAYDFARTAVDYRISRICNFTANEAAAASQDNACASFFKRIPFSNSELQIKAETKLPPSDQSLLSQVSVAFSDLGLDFQFKPHIKDELLAEWRAELENIVLVPRKDLIERGIYDDDLSMVAYMNQVLRLQLEPALIWEQNRFGSECQYATSLFRGMPYRRDNSRLSYSFCTDELGRSLTAARQPPTDPPAVEPEGAKDERKNTAGSADQTSSDGNTKTNLLPAVAPSAMDGTDSQTAFELVSHYRFYSNLIPFLPNVLIGPSEFIAFVLVVVSGILGSLLRLVLSSFSSWENTSWRDLLVTPIMGLISALLLYVVFRAGFIVLTDKPQSVDSTMMSPFVIAFVSIAAGLYSERAIKRIQGSMENILGADQTSELARYGVHLRDVMSSQNLSPAHVATRLGIGEDMVEAWINQSATVSPQSQRDLALVLGASPRTLFTDLPPE